MIDIEPVERVLYCEAQISRLPSHVRTQVRALSGLIAGQNQP